MARIYDKRALLEGVTFFMQRLIDGFQPVDFKKYLQFISFIYKSINFFILTGHSNMG
jgi:hypothetical protein